MIFYTGDMFPEKYKYAVFVAEHGLNIFVLCFWIKYVVTVIYYFI